MAYNKAKEEYKWKVWKEQEEKKLRELGVSEEVIAELRDYDWNCFKQERNYKNHQMPDTDFIERTEDASGKWEIQQPVNVQDFIKSLDDNKLRKELQKFGKWIHHIREIDYSIREKYEQYLMKEKKPEQVLRYLKTLDRIKQYHIRQEMKQFANIKKFYLKYEQQILFLPYLPDQKLAMEFDKVRDKTELVWDFSVKASEKMKQQIFQLLIHILENVKDPKDRRVRFLLPMQWMYQYCIKQGIVDIETIEQEEIEKLEEIVKQKRG